MKALYLECKMGASGNMLAGALLDLVPDSAAVIDRLNGLGIPGVRFSVRRVDASGFCGNQVRVTVHGAEEGHLHLNPFSHHSHRDLEDVCARIDCLPLSRAVRDHARSVYRLIAEAEAKVHETKVSQVHFHEVGSLDAIADVVCVCLLLELLEVDRIIASPVHAGSGTVRCAHGVLPVPAPATAELLKGIPWYAGDIPTELCTPTGAALLRHFAQEFGDMPAMDTEKVGYGFGTKELSRPNFLRAFLGEIHSASKQIYELKCNLDDMTPEALSYARQRLEEASVLDVTMISCMMKKNRPGILLTCLCAQEQLEEAIQLLLTHTTTAGVRYTLWQRRTLDYGFQTVQTPYGQIRTKEYSGPGIFRTKPEFDDAAAAASKAGVPLQTVLEACRTAEDHTCD